MTFQVGNHPYCPVHGHLIEKYGIHPHQVSRTEIIRRLPYTACMFFAIILGVVAGILSIVNNCKKRKEKAQPSTPPYSESCGGPPQG